MHQPIKKIAFLLFFSVVFFSHGLAQKTDKVLLTNGDWITGEVKNLDYGKLNFKTDAAGTIYIKWEDIWKIKSDKTFEIRMGQGLVYHGSLDTTDVKFKVIIYNDHDSIPVNLFSIVEIIPIKDLFWAKFDGNLDLGYSYTKGSQVTQFSLGSNIIFQAERYEFNVIANSIITNQPEKEIVKKQDYSLNYNKYLGKNWSILAMSKVEQNTELNLDRRLSLGTAFGKNWIKSNSRSFITNVGYVVNQEKSITENEIKVNQESLIHIEYRQFRYKDPEIDWVTYLSLFPSLSIPGRLRSDFNTNLRYELFNDFFLGLTFYHNLDNKPPEGGESTTDYGIVTSIGYKF